MFITAIIVRVKYITDAIYSHWSTYILMLGYNPPSRGGRGKRVNGGKFGFFKKKIPPKNIPYPGQITF